MCIVLRADAALFPLLLGDKPVPPLYSHRTNKPALGRDVYVAPNATIIGDVIIGDESSIWFGVVIRGDVFPIRIGSRTNIQDNSVVHVTNGKAATTIGDDVTVGHLTLIHGCTIGSRCLVGMGSIILDNAIVEDECFIAAGALVAPGMRLPSRSLAMGRPARVVRQLADADLAAIREAGMLYMQYARDFSCDVSVVE